MDILSTRCLTNLSGLDDRPLEAFYIQTDGSQHREQDDSLQTDLLALIMFWLSSPVQKCDDIFRHLRGGSGGFLQTGSFRFEGNSEYHGLTILILNKTVKQDASHGNSVSREVRVVIHAFTNFKSSGRVSIASKKGEDVVLDHGQ